MAESKRSNITDEHRAEAAALKALWDDGRKRRTQAEFGEAYGLGIQANVGHYLLGRSPLNIKAALAFAAELQCDVMEFSPRLARDLVQVGAPVLVGTQDAAAKELESRLLLLFRELPPESQEIVISMANQLHTLAKPEKSEVPPATNTSQPAAELNQTPAMQRTKKAPKAEPVKG